MSNLREIAVILTPEQAAFLIDNCNSNIEFGLKAIMVGGYSREAIEKLVALMESFKGIRKALQNAGVD